MALVVEDNTGLATAESYITQADFAAYCAARGREADNWTVEDQEQALRRAFLYINTNWRYKAAPVSNDQAGEFPRVNLSDGMGRVFGVVPQRVKDAQCEAAWIDLSEGPLFENLARGGMVQSESVGPISTTYAAGAPAEKLLQSVMRLVQPFVRDASRPRRPLPQFNPDTGTAIFSIGMDDNNGAAG